MASDKCIAFATDCGAFNRAREFSDGHAGPFVCESRRFGVDRSLDLRGVFWFWQVRRVRWQAARRRVARSE
eukprot:8294911-Lingulodinium_polyedra.AAC.1